MKFVMEIDLGNEAMADAQDIASAMYHTADTISMALAWGAGVNGPVRDANGNTVGSWKLEDQ